jgi:hypothetical protein
MTSVYVTVASTTLSYCVECVLGWVKQWGERVINACCQYRFNELEGDFEERNGANIKLLCWVEDGTNPFGLFDAPYIEFFGEHRGVSVEDAHINERQEELCLNSRRRVDEHFSCKLGWSTRFVFA